MKKRCSLLAMEFRDLFDWRLILLLFGLRPSFGRGILNVWSKWAGLDVLLASTLVIIGDELVRVCGERGCDLVELLNGFSA